VLRRVRLHSTATHPVATESRLCHSPMRPAAVARLMLSRACLGTDGLLIVDASSPPATGVLVPDLADEDSRSMSTDLQFAS
jgi:hypothetical protein